MTAFFMSVQRSKQACPQKRNLSYPNYGKNNPNDKGLTG
ncbi:hypothetical protein GPUN_2883 [Glaciecola punicea ACAM 611]|uniref:Uncharacterized protein n=1 Tax=Glaciecola punicea ACAM 611 TaxID=1121923 RepID=H5TF70_9ALTE|nr:hypothetical protein GPUN_2883 [Glaciecola punicea ACAM 611]